MVSKKVEIIFCSITTILVIGIIIILWQPRIPKIPTNFPPGDYSYTIEHAEQKILQLMKQQHLPSVAVTLIDDQDTIWMEAFGLANIEKHTPAKPNTVYKLWSLAKVFTAIEIVRLVEEGFINLDAPINTYLPLFSIQSRFPDSDPITIRSILTHRSGLPRNGCFQIDFNPYALSDLAASLKDCFMAYPVGYRYKYSNIGFDILGYIIQELRNTSFPDYMRESLFHPIGMDDSTFLRTQIPTQSIIAMGYEYYKGDYYPYEQNDIVNYPSGNLYSTIEDMDAFVKFIFRDGTTDEKQIISAEFLKSMFIDKASNARDPQSMGLGWKTADVLGFEKLVWHDGGPSEGTGALVAMLPERKLGVVLLANGTTFDGSVSTALALDLLEMMLRTKYGEIPTLEETKAPSEVEHTVLEGYAGKYVAFGEGMEVFVKGDHLKASIQGFTFNLNPLSDNTFQPSHWLTDIGLANLLGNPIDLRQLKVEFMPRDKISDDMMIIHIGDLSYEFCPKYPDNKDNPALWEKLIGDYDMSTRLKFGAIDKNIIGSASIWIENGLLQMGGVVGPILPINENEIIILSGPFAGETMFYESETGNIYHRMYVLIRKIYDSD
jgi:CubicO group peptidase (beta-lactamase class C family)